MLLRINYLKASLLSALTLALTCLTLTANGQKTTKAEPHIKMTKNGTSYQLIGWESNVVYNPHTFTWFAWEEPIVKKSNVKMTSMVPVSEFDRPPVFDGYCLTKKDKLACSNEKLQKFISDRYLDYPDAAKDLGQEGLEYVTFTINEEGKFEGNLKVVSKNKPCNGCADAAAEIVASMEDKWFPAIKDGKTVKTQLTVPVRFRLFDQ